MIYKKFNIKTFFLTLGAFLIFILGIASISNGIKKDIFKVEIISLKNIKNFPISDIENKTNKLIGNSLENTNVESLKEEIMNIGWVKNVSIRKNFPNEILVKIEEKIPFAVWMNNGKYLFIEEDGSVINYPIKFSYKDFILVENKVPPSNLKDFFRELNKNKYIKSKVISIFKVSNRRYDIKIRSFDNIIKIKLPENNVSQTLNKLEELDKNRDFFKRNFNEVDTRNSDWIIR